MDRSYLSDKSVVAASRGFICVRLVTYESESEMEFMKSTYNFRTPTKNSLFAILASDGKQHLVDPGRSMKGTFDDAAAMALRMQAILRESAKAKKESAMQRGLPYLQDVRVAMNVAACDSQRMVVVYANTDAERKELESMLTPLAWNKDLVGKLLYARSADEKDLGCISGSTLQPGLLVIEPDAFGLKARQVGYIKLGTSGKQALSALITAAEGNELGAKDSKRHIGQGRRTGVHWEQLVEDKGLERGRRGRGR